MRRQKKTSFSHKLCFSTKSHTPGEAIKICAIILAKLDSEGWIMQQLHINEFINATIYGASCPVIVKADDNNTYVLKTRYQSNLSLDGNGVAEILKDCSVYIETLSYLLLEEFGFEYIPEIVYLVIDDDALEDAQFRFKDASEREEMALDNIQNSKGLNLGVRWIENSEGAFEKFGAIPKKIREMAINHDAYVLNSDRDESNPNILFSRDNNKFYLIDFGNAFDTSSVFDDLYEKNGADITQWFVKYIFDMHYLFFDEIDSVVKYKKRFSQDDILDIMSQLPCDWKPNEQNQKIAEILSRRIANKEIFENA